METMQNTQPVNPDTPLAVTLQAQQWNVVMGAMGKAPYEVVASLISIITQQLQERAAEANQPTVTNGAGHVGVPSA